MVVDTHSDKLKGRMPKFALPRNSQGDGRSESERGARSSLSHIVDPVGPDHVGLRSDFGMPSSPEGLKYVTKMPKITAELVGMGYSEEQVKKVLG